jgi:hypothetical protein
MNDTVARIERIAIDGINVGDNPLRPLARRR